MSKRSHSLGAEKRKKGAGGAKTERLDVTMRLLVDMTFRYMCSHLRAAKCNLLASCTSWGLSVSLRVTPRSTCYRALRISHSHPNWTALANLWASSLHLNQPDYRDYSAWTWNVLKKTDLEMQSWSALWAVRVENTSRTEYILKANGFFTLHNICPFLSHFFCIQFFQKPTHLCPQAGTN